MTANSITSKIQGFSSLSVSRLFALAAIVLVAAYSAFAGPHYVKDAKTLLIINSYNESSPWSRAVTLPINSFVQRHGGIHVEMMHINNNTIKDSTAYYNKTNPIFEKFANKAPDGVVMLGNMAFNMRDRIKEEWGDVPILLLARQMEYGPLDYYFSGYQSRVTDGDLMPLASIRDEYNFTVVLMPDLYKQTIDLMTDLIPDMNRFVFVSDGIYLNRVLSTDIDEYIQAQYPGISYEWMHASSETTERLHDLLVTREPRTGLLMSTWFYEMTDSNHSPVLVTGDLNLISSSVNPIFSLRQSYINLGTVGGVYPDYEQVKLDVTAVLEKMFQGYNLRKVPFFDHEKCFPIVNYPMLLAYGLNPDACPENTVFDDKPLTWWEQYRIAVLVIIILVLLATLLIWRKSDMQHRAEMYVKHVNRFVNNMPLPYSMAKVKFDKKGAVVGAEYTLKNEAFEQIIEQNAMDGDAEHLFPKQFIASKVEELLATNRPVSFTYHFEHTDQYYDFLLCTVDRGDGKKNEKLEVDIFATNNTESYKLSSRLETASNKLALVLNAASLVPWQWHVKTQKLYYNVSNVREEMYVLNAEVSEDNEVATTVQDVLKNIHPDDLHMVKTQLQTILDGSANEISMQFRKTLPGDPSKFEWLEISGMVTKRTTEGAPMVVTGSMQFVTERKQQEEEMRRAIERANESDYLKSAFLANMSHEIRTPLNAIVGFSGLVAKTDSKEKREEFAQIIEKNNELLLTIVNDVLDLAKIESNTIDLSFGPCDINQVLEKMAETVDVRLPKGVVLNIAPGANVCVANTDENRLSQVLINLLTNACKFTSKGSISVGYDILDGDELSFFVKDTGIGIAAEDQERVFQRFIKVNNFVQGTGLGLPICKSIVEKMGGAIGVRSDGPGKGSTFWFTLPYVPAELEASTDLEKIAEAAESDGRLQPKHMGLPQSERLGTMLVAEDNHSNFRLIEHFLGSSYKIVRAENGAEAVDLYKKHNPDVILMDISMPVMDGYQATEEIRKMSNTVPIIAVTAYALNSDRQRIMRSGFTSYVSKPIIQKDLIQAVMNCTEGLAC